MSRTSVRRIRETLSVTTLFEATRERLQTPNEAAQGRILVILFHEPVAGLCNLLSHLQQKVAEHGLSSLRGFEGVEVSMNRAVRVPGQQPEGRVPPDTAERIHRP